MKNSRNLWIIVGIIVTLGVFAYTRSYAAKDDTESLKAQINEQQQRIAQLEAQLKQSQASSSNSPSANYVMDPWDPFSEIDMLHQRMNQMFLNSMARGHGFSGSDFFNPQVDLKESDKEYVLTMDIPGMTKENIDIKVENQQLIVSGEKNSTNEENKNGKVYKQERSYGHFMRVIPLPDDAKADSVDASYENGVLTIKIARDATPKTEAKKITIK